MKRYITQDDLIDTYSRLKQRGSHFLLSKFTINNKNRTISAFDDTAIHSSNWWMIPMVKERWNKKLAGNANMNYRQFMMEYYFKESSSLKLLSLGSGSCGHELELAYYSQFSSITCVDLAQNRLDEAEDLSKKQGITKMNFVCSDIDDFEFKENEYDIVLFNSSLHHFKNVDRFLSSRIKTTLKPQGHLVINEFVGATRLQFPNDQISAIKTAIQMIDPKSRKRFKTNISKNSFSGSGIWRMIMADPSECIDSSSIIPALHQHFEIKVEKKLGGNILMNALKDISHHFINPNESQKQNLTQLFHFEDEYLKTKPSDFIFGIYQNKK